MNIDKKELQLLSKIYDFVFRDADLADPEAPIAVDNIDYEIDAPEYKALEAKGLIERLRGKHLVRITSSGIKVVEDTVIRVETIAGSNVADVASEKDFLGFDVYVEAIGAYLTHKDTKGPLTLSIEGEWGSGKSSFMLQLRKWLCDRHKVKTVWFNAWRHDNEEALWAAFALQFVEEMTTQMESIWRRLQSKWRLMRNRFDWRNGWYDLLRTALLMLLWLVIAVAIWVFGHETVIVNGKTVGLPDTVWILLGLGGSLAAFQRLFLTIRDTVEIVGNPLRFNFKKHIQDPNYAERIGFIEQFHRDFKKIVDVYAVEEKVFIFIDDLDRCKVPKAADMMQAMNLMIGEDSRLFFIVGMDRQKIAAGLAVKFEKLLPYIQLNSEDNFEGINTKVGIRFGYDFIEKFIQLPFRVPIPGLEKIESLLKSLKEKKDIRRFKNGKKQSERLKIIKWLISKYIKKVTAEQINSEEPELKVEMNRKWNNFALKVADDSEAVQESVKTLAAFFNFNPRRIKQFINMFRLKAYISYNTGLFNPPTEKEDVQAVTFEQLSKFVAIELRWPLLLANIEDDNNLLQRLSLFAEQWKYEKNSTNELIAAQTISEGLWRKEADLLELIAINANPNGTDEKSIYNNYSLTQLDVGKLLKVSARVHPPQIKPPSQTASKLKDDSVHVENTRFRDIERVMESVKEELLSRHNVVGVEVGNKIVGGIETVEPSIRVRVKQKLPKSKLSRKDLIPSVIKNIPTDVVGIGGAEDM